MPAGEQNVLRLPSRGRQKAAPFFWHPDIGTIRLVMASNLVSFFDKKLHTGGASKMGKAPKKEPTKPLRMKVSARLYAYLGWLRRNTMLGSSENDVAEYLLTQRLEAMRQAKYSEPDLLEGNAITEQSPKA